VSMLERVIEERARATRIRRRQSGRGDAGVGTDLSQLEAGLGRGAACEGRARRSRMPGASILKWASGRTPSVHQAPVLSAWHMYGCRSAPESVGQSRARRFLWWQAMGASLAPASAMMSPARLRGRSALLLSKAKDNNASVPSTFVRFFDAGFSLDDVRTMEISLE